MQEDIGQNLYLFRADPNAYADELVISAHGGISKSNPRTFTVQWGRLIFYSAHGTVTDDYGIAKFVFGGPTQQQSQILNLNDTCYDYELSKYQGKHASNTDGTQREPYSLIAERQAYVAEYNQRLTEAGPSAPPGSQAATPFDVLTVRSRNDFAGARRVTGTNTSVRLSAALEAVGQRHQYTTVHCYFCRSTY
jgi:hypothetical protein